MKPILATIALLLVSGCAAHSTFEVVDSSGIHEWIEQSSNIGGNPQECGAYWKSGDKGDYYAAFAEQNIDNSVHYFPTEKAARNYVERWCKP